MSRLRCSDTMWWDSDTTELDGLSPRRYTQSCQWKEKRQALCLQGQPPASLHFLGHLSLPLTASQVSLTEELVPLKHTKPTSLGSQMAVFTFERTNEDLSRLVRQAHWTIRKATSVFRLELDSLTTWNKKLINPASTFGCLLCQRLPYLTLKLCMQLQL